MIAATLPRELEPSRRWPALALICLASLLIVLDGTIVNVALPTIQRDLGFTQSALAWVVNAYLLTFGGFMLLAGRAADLFGRRRVLMTGIALFTLASLTCGLANSQGVLIVARGIQGIGGAIGLAVLASIALLRTASLTAAAQPSAAAINSGYHAAFFVAAGLSLAAALLAASQLKETTTVGKS